MCFKRRYLVKTFLILLLLPQFEVSAAVKGKIIKTVNIPVDYKSIKFSNNGKRVGFTEAVGDKVRAVVDGKRGKPYDNVTVVEFTPNGKHYFYGASKGGEWFLVRDGKIITKLGNLTSVNQGTGMSIIGGGRSITIRSSLMAKFSPKSSNYFVLAYQNGTGKIFKDGKWLKHKFSTFWDKGMAISPDGKHYAFTVQPESSRSASFYIDGKKYDKGGEVDNVFYLQPKNKLAFVQGSTLTINDSKGALVSKFEKIASRVALSSDDKHFAALQYKPNKKQSVIVDGKNGPEYDSVIWGSDSGWYNSPNSFVWSNNYLSHAYLVKHADKSMAVSVNGKTLKSFPSIVKSSLTLSSNGRDVAYIIKNDKQESIVHNEKIIGHFEDVKDVILQGKKGKLVYSVKKNKHWLVIGLGKKTKYKKLDYFFYSPNKKYISYAASAGKNKWQLFVNGNAVTGKYDGILRYPSVEISNSGIVSFVVKDKQKLKWIKAKVR